MPVFPYRVRPVPPLLAVLLEDGNTVLLEEGNECPLAELPEGYRVWGSWELVNELWGDGHGEALCWQGRPVRWRAAKHQDELHWVNRHTDVRVLRMYFPLEVERTMSGFIAWRDWLGSHGAAPSGSLGSSAFSLLRATLHRPLWTSIGWEQCGTPVPYVLGGRQELLKQGRFEPARHYDLPAAYANQLGGMRYGGHWTAVGKGYPYALVARRGVLCFVRARVRVPALPIGPLPRRPRRAPQKTDAMLSFSYGRYPTDCTLQGVWTWEEVEAASEAGCKVRVLDVWIHHSRDGAYPFLYWWEAVQEGRALPGFAGELAKASGNALWGQFCITPGAERTVVQWAGTRRRPERYKRVDPMVGRSPHYAPDLAETLTGRVRADLFRCMYRTGPPLLCAHTDGIWTEGAVVLPGEWRAKEKVARLDLLTPQFMRYYRQLPATKLGAEYVVAGAPDTLAPAIFEFTWDALAQEGTVPA